MKIAVLVYGPEFGCSENLTRAFARWGDVRLISHHGSDWREYDAGLVLAPDTVAEARGILAEADLIWIGDAISFYTLGQAAPERDWVSWVRTKRIMVHFGDTAFFKHAAYYEGLCAATGARPMFLLPDLVARSSAPWVPLHHPQRLLDGEKAARVTVIHSPGRDGKALAKGTPAIEEVIYRLQDVYDFDYQRLMHLTLAECLAVKATGHIMIDQVPPPGITAGLGRNGLEGMAAGLATITAMYDPALLNGYFEPPPVLVARTPEDLELALARLLGDPALLAETGAKSRQWVADNLEVEPWLAYVGKYL